MIKNKFFFKMYILSIINTPFIFFIFFPDQPQLEWQHELLNFIHNDLHITIGANGPIPLFTVLTMLYIMVIMSVLLIVISIKQYRNIGLGKRFQNSVYRYIDENITNAKYTIWLKDYPILRKLYIYLLHSLVVIFSIWHLTDQDISFHSGRRGGIIGLAYRHRLGVIVFEYLFQFLILANLYLLIIYIVYSFNIIRGYGWGNEFDRKNVLKGMNINRSRNKKKIK